MKRRWRNVLFVLVGGAVGIWIAENLPDTPTVASVPDVDPTRAPRGACRIIVKNALHDPGSAEWVPGIEWVVERLDEGQNDSEHWVVWPELRARNAYGALVKSRFRCEVRSDGDKWTAVSLTEDG